MLVRVVVTRARPVPDVRHLLHPGDPAARPAAVTARALLRLLGVGPLSATCRTCGGPHGRPVADGAYVSLSYAGDLVAVAVCATPVGVDVELVAATGFAGFPAVALGEGEPDGDRTRSWTRKEAALKATGDGLTVDPRSVDVTGDLVRWADAPGPIGLADLTVPEGWAGAVAAWTASPLRVVELDGGALLTEAGVPEGPQAG